MSLCKFFFFLDGKEGNIQGRFKNFPQKVSLYQSHPEYHPERFFGHKVVKRCTPYTLSLHATQDWQGIHASLRNKVVSLLVIIDFDIVISV